MSTAEWLLAAHALFSAVFLLLMHFHMIKAPMTLWPVLVFFPFVGETVILLVWTHTMLGLNGKDNLNIYRLENRKPVEEEFVFDEGKRDDSVPLQDVLELGSGQDRRRVMRDAIMSGRFNEGKFLREAEGSDDMEIVHFASTALAGEENKVDTKINDLTRKLREDTGDYDAMIRDMDEYIQVLQEYLRTGNENSMSYNTFRVKYISMVERRMAMNPDLKHVLLLADCYLDLNDSVDARRPVNILKEEYPFNAQSWIMRFRYYYRSKDRENMDRMIREYGNEPRLKNKRIDEIIGYWKKEGAETV